MEDEDVPEPSVEAEAEDHAFPQLTVREVATRLGQPGFHVYDTNAPSRWKRSHVPGAKNLEAYDFDASALPENTSATLVFYCAGPG
ncbi:MAG TPA: rhodanese-like domain-containing protein [Kofleriaceae bacterium]|nr:rhodanese-like domain-containing protein [Kofleriaceae bacterium]